MRLIDADALIDTLIDACNNDQFKFLPVWIEKQIDAQPTVAMQKEQETKIIKDFMGMSDTEEIARFLMDHVREQKVSVTLTVEPERTEVSIQPWD